MEKCWEDWVNLVMGVWLFFSPFTLNYTMLQAVWNAWLLGIAIIIFTVWALSIPKVWKEWTTTILSLWLVISPWLAGFSQETDATWNFVMVGLIIFVLSVKAILPSHRKRIAAG